MRFYEVRMRTNDVFNHLTRFFSSTNKGKNVFDIIFDEIFNYYNCEAGTLYLKKGGRLHGRVVRGPKQKKLKYYIFY